MSREAEKAGLWARCITTSAAIAVLGAASFGRLHEAIAVPSMPEGLFRTETYVEIVEPEPVPETRDRTPERIEHVVEKSDFTVPERPAPDIPATGDVSTFFSAVPALVGATAVAVGTVLRRRR